MPLRELPREEIIEIELPIDGQKVNTANGYVCLTFTHSQLAGVILDAIGDDDDAEALRQNLIEDLCQL